MDIPKAIELLDNIYMRGYKVTTKEQYTAIKLGIEALKRAQTTRRYKDPGYSVLLLGETRD